MNSKDIPVIGWLVCTEGADKGKDFPLINNQMGNGIGSSENNAVVVREDANVVADNHAVIRLDERCGKCYITPGFGKRIVRLNGAIVFAASYLKPYDRIGVGASEFAFIPYGGMVDPNVPFVKIKNKNPMADILTETKDSKVSPCVGWMVNRGPDSVGIAHTLTADYNYIGRSTTMAVSLPNDASLADENHAAVVYDSKDNMFYFVPYATNTPYFINGQPVAGVIPLNGFEEIAIGATRVCFVPFCGEYFRW